MHVFTIKKFYIIIVRVNTKKIEKCLLILNCIYYDINEMYANAIVLIENVFIT